VATLHFIRGGLSMTRVKLGMTINEVREIWLSRTEVKSQTILDSYAAARQKSGSGGREGLGIYGIYQERIAREKVRLAVKLLEKAGLEISERTINKVTGQSTGTIRNYWIPPKREPPENSISAA
jgi:DNA invertase Pin-like site-specific DNA recombinase